MVAIWCVIFLQKIKAITIPPTKEPNISKKKFSLLEFGPGRGTLMMDVIRVLQHFKLLDGVEINFIEYSPFMRKLQQENIIKQLQKYDIWLKNFQ